MSVKKMKPADDCRLPVVAFTDGNPYGYCNIYRTRSGVRF